MSFTLIVYGEYGVMFTLNFTLNIMLCFCDRVHLLCVLVCAHCNALCCSSCARCTFHGWISLL